MLDRSVFSVDEFAWKLASSLLEDLRPALSDSWYTAVRVIVDTRNVPAFRNLPVDLGELPSGEFKARRQIVDLFKKHSFAVDVLAPQEIYEDSEKKFFDNQDRLNTWTLDKADLLVREVLFGARGYASLWLGDFSKFDVLKEATFGKKSSVGIPMREACEGARYEAPISGSYDHILWFQHLFGVWNKPAFNYARSRTVPQRPSYMEVDTLEAVLVDKTWKSLRMIMPNTTLGTLYSSGVGRVIERAIRANGYDIRLLQPVHGELARFGSITGTLVTADQSMASDNITLALMAEILDRHWAAALMLGRIGKVKLGSRTIETKTLSTMGIGFTFPIQTLIFLSILHSIRDMLHLGEDTVISVFGDDLVYDRRMHDFVVDIFPRLGLVLNLEKTFSEGNFRESCGYDYYHGHDVRPYHLARSDSTDVGRRRYEAILYKSFNGLHRRWNKEDLSSTRTMLKGEMETCRGNKTLCFVPPDYPDTSGMRTSLDEIEEPHTVRRDLHGTYNFRYLAFEPDHREEVRHTPYLFQQLRKEVHFDPLAMLALRKVGILASSCGFICSDSPSSFKEEIVKDRKSVRSTLSGRRLRPIKTLIPEMERGRYRERPGTTVRWPR